MSTYTKDDPKAVKQFKIRDFSNYKKDQGKLLGGGGGGTTSLDHWRVKHKMLSQNYVSGKSTMN